MNRLKTIKKYFNNAVLEKAFIKLLGYKMTHKTSITFAVDYISDNELACLSLFYNKPDNFEKLVELIEQDIDYILEG